MVEETTETSSQEAQTQTSSLLGKIRLHKFKILGSLLGILVFAGAVFGAYKLGQKQIQPVSQPTLTPLPSEVSTEEGDPTANWKTYTNTEYGFEFKYPINWSTYDNTQKTNSKTLELYLLNVPEGTPWPDDFLGVVKVYKGISDLTQWFHSEVEFTEAKKQEFINLAKASGYNDIAISDLSQSYIQTTVSGYPVIEQTILCHRQNCYFMAGPQNKKDYYFKKGDTVVLISFLTLFPDETFPILDKIASTFKFLE